MSYYMIANDKYCITICKGGLIRVDILDDMVVYARSAFYQEMEQAQAPLRWEDIKPVIDRMPHAGIWNIQSAFGRKLYRLVSKVKPTKHGRQLFRARLDALFRLRIQSSYSHSCDICGASRKCPGSKYSKVRLPEDDEFLFVGSDQLIPANFTECRYLGGKHICVRTIGKNGYKLLRLNKMGQRYIYAHYGIKPLSLGKSIYIIYAEPCKQQLGFISPDEPIEEAKDVISWDIEIGWCAEPVCAQEGYEHKWMTPWQIVGGSQANPGYLREENGMIMRKLCCSRCGKYAIASTGMPEPETGISSLFSLEYDEADTKSLQWIAQQ